jgi:hypothetical protein
MTEKQISVGQWLSHVGENVRVVSKHSGQAFVCNAQHEFFYVPYEQLRPKIPKAQK